MRKIKFLDLKENYLSIKEEIDEEYKNTFNKCDFILGKNVTIFENNFANYLDCKYFLYLSALKSRSLYILLFLINLIYSWLFSELSITIIIKSIV